MRVIIGAATTSNRWPTDHQRSLAEQSVTVAASTIANGRRPKGRQRPSGQRSLDILGLIIGNDC